MREMVNTTAVINDILFIVTGLFLTKIGIKKELYGSFASKKC